jgi:hypothetical protein
MILIIILKLALGLKNILRVQGGKFVRMYLVFVLNFWKDGLMEEETIRILYQRTQNG